MLVRAVSAPAVGSSSLPYWREKSLPEVEIRILSLPSSPLIIPTQRKTVLINSISQRKREENDPSVYVNPNSAGPKISHPLDFFLAELTL